MNRLALSVGSFIIDKAGKRYYILNLFKRCAECLIVVSKLKTYTPSYHIDNEHVLFIRKIRLNYSDIVSVYAVSGDALCNSIKAKYEEHLKKEKAKRKKYSGTRACFYNAEIEKEFLSSGNSSHGIPRYIGTVLGGKMTPN